MHLAERRKYSFSLDFDFAVPTPRGIELAVPAGLVLGRIDSGVCGNARIEGLSDR